MVFFVWNTCSALFTFLSYGTEVSSKSPHKGKEDNMKRWTIALFLTSFLLMAFACASTQEREEPKAPIVLVSFGVFPTDDLSAFESLEREFGKRFPGHLVRWAFTDKTVLEQISNDQFVYFTERADGREPADVAAMLRTEGYREIVMQPLLMLPSQGTASLTKLQQSGMGLVVGDPVIHSEKHIEAVIQALEPDIKSEVTTLIVAPGDAGYLRHQDLLVDFADAMEAKYNNVFVLSAEGRPGERRLEEAKVQAGKYERVHVMPLVFMPSEEAITHRVFETQEAWRDLLAEPKTSFEKAMVKKERVRDVLFDRVDRAIQETKTVQ
jgi:cobalamin biosynthesis Co2+ chelatase CbiK